MKIHILIVLTIYFNVDSVTTAQLGFEINSSSEHTWGELSSETLQLISSLSFSGDVLLVLPGNAGITGFTQGFRTSTLRTRTVEIAVFQIGSRQSWSSNENLVNNISHSSLLIFAPSNESSFLEGFESICNFHVNNDEKQRQGSRNPTGLFLLIWPSRILADNWSFICRLLFENTWLGLTNLRLNSNVYIVLFLESETSKPQYLEIYANKDQVKCRSVGAENFYDLNNKLKRRHDFGQIKIVATSAMANIWTEFEIEWEEREDGTICCANGSAISIFEDLQVMLNFSGAYKSGDWISRFPNGTYYGLTIELLKNGSADLMIRQARIVVDKDPSALQYLQPTSQEGIHAYFRQPSPASMQNMYIIPFEKKLWAGILLLWVILGSIATIISMSKSKIWSSAGGGLRDFDENGGFLWATAFLCAQGWHTSPNSLTMRLVFISGVLTFILIYFVYCATLISALTLQVIPIKNFDELVSSHMDIYGDDSNRLVKELLKCQRTKAKNSRKVIEEINERQGPSIILNQSQAYLQVSRYFQLLTKQMNLSESDLGKIYSVQARKTQNQNSMLIPKGSPLTEFFNYKIIQLKERGFNFRYMKRFNKQTGITIGPSSRTRHSSSAGVYRENLSFKEVISAFEILSFGTLAAIMFIVFEIGLAWRRFSRFRIIF